MRATIQRYLGDLHWSHWLSVLGLGLLFVALRWNNFNAPFIRDEGECAYAAQLLIQGVAPYQHAFIQKPPGAVYTYALANLLLPQHFWSPRLLAYMFVALATALLGMIARLEFGAGFALPAMWLMTPMVLLPGMDQFSCNPEMFLLLPLLATMGVYSYSRRYGHKNVHWFAAGGFAATTLIFKYTALFILMFLFIAWLIEMFQSKAGIAAIVRALLCLLAGGILAAVLELGFYLSHDRFKSLWECTVAFNRYYVASGVFAGAILWAELKMFWSHWWILFLMPCALLLQWRCRIWFWLGLFGCAVVATSGSCYLQYYIPLMPFWALLNVVGIHAFACKISGWMAKPMPWLASVVTGIVLLLVILPDVPFLLCSEERFAEEKMEGYPFIEAQPVAERVSRMTSPNDYVFVAGSEPEILCYAQRFSPTRFITSYPLMYPSPFASDYQNAAIQDLKDHAPKVIVFVNSSASWARHPGAPPDFLDFLNNFVKQNYAPAGGFVKMDGQAGYWSDQLTAQEFANATLLLYQRKD